MKFTKTTAAIITTGVVAISAAAFTMPKVASGEINLPGIDATLQNHEARISNNEKDIKALQDNTNTPPAPNHVDVPTATSQPLAGPPSAETGVAVNAPTPADTKTVVKATPISSIGSVISFQCKYEYDDGSSETVDVGSESITTTAADGTTHVNTNPVCLAVGTVVPK